MMLTLDNVHYSKDFFGGIFCFWSSRKTLPFLEIQFNSKPGPYTLLSKVLRESRTGAGHNQSRSVLCVKALGEQLQCQRMKD